MPKRICYIHTVASLVQYFKDLAKEFVPDADVFNVLDESLLQNTIRAGKLQPDTYWRLAGYLSSAQQAGARLVLVTCSSLGPAVDLGRHMVNIPVLRVDEPMAESAVKMGSRIGIAATLNTTLEPTSTLIVAKAKAAGRRVEVVSGMCEGAFEAVMAGDTARHDAIVSAGLRALIDTCDVIVLAQASMARVVDALPESDKRIPILSSPRPAMERLAAVYQTL